MKSKNIVFILFGCILLLSSSITALAYTSDRMNFGDIDFKGATVRLVAHVDALAQFEEGGVRAGRLEEAKELFNIGGFEKEIVDWGAVGDTVLNRFISGDSTYDLWRVPFHFYWGLASRGAFYPVNEILPDEYFAQLPNITHQRNQLLAHKGQLFHYSVGTFDFGHSSFVVFNKDLLEAEGLDDPYELYRNGEWTWDVVTEMAITATRDTDGDGIVDQWGLSDNDPKNFVYAYGGAITRRDEDGRVYFSMDEPAALAGLRQWVDWVKVDQVASGGENEFATGQIAMAFLPFYAVENHPNWPFTHGILPYPQGPYTDEPVFLPGAGDAFFLSRQMQSILRA